MNGLRRLNPTTRPSGFTLLELLIVIAIVAILAALLLPASGRVKVSAHSAACKSNLRQIGIGLRLYVDEFEKYPVNVLVAWTNQHSFQWTWQEFLLPFAGSNTSLFRCPNRILGTQDMWPGLYGYNSRGADTHLEDGEHVEPWVNATRSTLGLAHLGAEHTRVPGFQVLIPSDMIAIGDGPGYSLHPYPASLTGYYGGMDDAHNGGANAVFCDGHVEYDKLRNWFKSDDAHRKRWNNDNQPHSETWLEHTGP